MIDYPDLFTRYIALILYEEGVDHIIHKEPYGYFKTSFSEAEREELRRLSKAAHAVVLPEPTDADDA